MHWPLTRACPATLQTHLALVGFHMAPVGHAHIEVAPAALLSVNTILGDPPLMGQKGCTKLRLFCSPVNPSSGKEGAFMVPLLSVVLTTIVDPLLKLA